MADDGMTEEERAAYEAARALIAEVKRVEGTRISFDAECFDALTRIPDEIAGLETLTRLDLDNTRITDLTPVFGLKGLQALWLDQTGVTDLTPIRGQSGLQILWLNQTGVTDLTPIRDLTGLHTLSVDLTGVTDLTPIRDLTGLQTLCVEETSVTDLRPLIGLENLGEGEYGGLWFQDTPAVRLDETLARLAQIKDNRQRARETLAYLRTLPPWPEPAG